MNLLIHFLGFPSPFILSLPLIVPMGLLLYSLGFLGPFTPTLPLLILMGLLAINPTISACWACFLIPLLFSLFHFFYIVGLLLLLDPLSKVSINIQPLEHMNCFYNSYANTHIIIFYSFFFFLNSGPRLVSFPAMNRLVSSNFPISSYSGT